MEACPCSQWFPSHRVPSPIVRSRACVCITRHVLTFPASGETYLAIAGQVIAADFPEPEMRSEGYTWE